MRLPQGYATITDPDKPIREADTFTCAHCPTVVHVAAGCDPADLGGVCTLCSTGKRPAFICKNCAGKPCTPFEKRLEKAEAVGRLRRDMGIESSVGIRW